VKEGRCAVGIFNYFRLCFKLVHLSDSVDLFALSSRCLSIEHPLQLAIKIAELETRCKLVEEAGRLHLRPCGALILALQRTVAILSALYHRCIHRLSVKARPTIQRV